MKVSTRTQVLAAGAVLAVFVLVVAVLLAVDDTPAPARGEPSAGASELVRDDSHVLGEPGSSGVTFVEFLDFECEGCRAAYPFVEELRATYAGEVTFVVRYFPMPGHRNARPAALAAEAAARQDAFEPMYHRMYETQPSWGESRDDRSAVFAGLADDLGLDPEQFDADVADPATAARVQRDVDDGFALGVAGTPTFFVDGRRVEPRYYGDFTDAIDAALAAVED